MLSPRELATLLEDVKEDILLHYSDELTQIILFGSYARGIATEDSDIDLLVLFKHKTSQMPDLFFGYEMANKYYEKTEKHLHLVFEKKQFYNNCCEDFYRDVPDYGKIIWQ